jgi:hypothetical protein
MTNPTDPCAQRAAFVAGQNLDRVALLCDQLLRLGVPRDAVQPVADWLNDQKPNGAPRLELPK